MPLHRCAFAFFPLAFQTSRSSRLLRSLCSPTMPCRCAHRPGCQRSCPRAQQMRRAAVVTDVVVSDRAAMLIDCAAMLTYLVVTDRATVVTDCAALLNNLAVTEVAPLLTVFTNSFLDFLLADLEV